MEDSVPESKVRKDAAEKKKKKRASERAAARKAPSKLNQDRSWVPWVFIPVGLIGVAWMVVYNLAGAKIGFMTALGGWNVVIGMVFFMAAFGIATMWK